MTERRERNVALRLRYDGSAYHGWQFQQNALTLQEVLETALRRLTGEEIPRGVFGCSRTDAGVHARTYVANFQTRCTIPADRFPAALRPFLPPDLSLVAARDVPEDFHARFSCVGKEYVYRIYGGKAPDPFLYHRAYYYPYPLDVEKMDAAARLICGKRDFKVFMATGSIVKDTCRTVQNCRVEERDGVAEITISADGFLYNMVRIIAGTLIGIGQGKLSPDCLSKALVTLNRLDLGVTAPACGLELTRVEYNFEDRKHWFT